MPIPNFNQWLLSLSGIKYKLHFMAKRPKIEPFTVGELQKAWGSFLQWSPWCSLLLKHSFLKHLLFILNIFYSLLISVTRHHEIFEIRIVVTSMAVSMKTMEHTHIHTHTQSVLLMSLALLYFSRRFLPGKITFQIAMLSIPGISLKSTNSTRKYK